MNHLSKKLHLVLVAAATLPLLLVTAPVAAHDGEDHSTSTTRSTSKNFCTLLTTNSDKISSSLGNLKTKKDSSESERNTSLQKNRDKWDQAIKDSWAKWDAQRAANYTKLRAKATTDAQKTAVETYITTMTNAIKARRDANTAARTTFRIAVDAAINEQHNSINTQASSLTAAVNSAIDTAKASCAANPTDASSVRTTLITALKTARETFASSRKADTGLGTKIKALAQTRNDAIKTNNSTFTATAKAARDALKEAFGSDAGNV